MTTITSSTCERCGAKVDPGARFCMSCGSKVPTALVSALPAAIPQTPQALLESLREATLGEYEILAQLGQGGMATVFLGHDIHLDRKVAIKVMSPALLSGEGMIERFKLEARTAAKLSHPHIIPIFAVRELGSLLYFVMKFVEGRPLDSIIHEVGPLPIPMVQTILARVADALGYAHRNGVVHRDIKPANIMIDVEGMPVVTDFGIAKVAEKQGLTMTGATIGTPTYMSPEQCMSQEITGASDQYSLGIVANEMLTGKPPFDADSMMTIMYKHCHEAPPPVTRARMDCPFQLQDAVLRMLEKSPEDRWPSMEEVSSIFDPGALAFDDPSRTQLVSLAKNGSNTRLLQSISTPRSQTPVSGPAGKRSRAGQKTAQDERVSTGAKTIRVSAPSASAAAKKKKLGLGMVVGGLGAVAGVVAVLMWSPWRASGDTNQGSHPSPGAPGPTAVVARLEGLPSSLSVAVNATQPLTPRAQDSTGAAMAGAVFTFSSDQSAVVDVSPQGIVRGLRAGTATVTVSSGAVRASIPVTVTAPALATQPGPTPAPRGGTAPVASISIQGPSAPIEVGQRVPLQASARDARGGASTERITWASSNQSIATVNEAGQVEGTGAGTVRITASAGGKTEGVSITVQPEAVGGVRVVPSNPVSLGAGATMTLLATPLTANGRELPARPVIWSSSNPSVVRVNGTGTIEASNPGTASVTAEIEGRRASVEITVRPAASTTNPTTPTVSPREAVENVIQEYGRALAQKDFEAIRQLFPDIPSRQLGGLREFVEPLRSITVTMSVRNVDVSGETATASVHQVIQLVERNGRANTVPGDPTIRLRRIDGVWRIVELK